MNRPQFLPRSSKNVAKNVADISYCSFLRRVLKNMGRRCITVGVFMSCSLATYLHKAKHQKTQIFKMPDG